MAPKKTGTIGRGAGGLPRYYLDVGWWRHKRFAGLDSNALFIAQAAISYGNEHGSDGHMPADSEDLAMALGVRHSDLIRAHSDLIRIGFWIKIRSEMVVRDWAQHNPTSGEIEELAEERSTLGARGNHVRWHLSRGFLQPGCKFCDEEGPNGDPFGDPEPDRLGDPVSDPVSDPNGIANASHGIGRDGIGTAKSSLSVVLEREPQGSRDERVIEAITAAGTKDHRDSSGRTKQHLASCISTRWQNDGKDTETYLAEHPDASADDLTEWVLHRTTSDTFLSEGTGETDRERAERLARMEAEYGMGGAA